VHVSNLPSEVTKYFVYVHQIGEGEADAHVDEDIREAKHTAKVQCVVEANSYASFLHNFFRISRRTTIPTYICRSASYTTWTGVGIRRGFFVKSLNLTGS
jgi:hypothetical protein